LPKVSRLPYEINSIYVEPSKREYTLIAARKVNIPNEHISDVEFFEKLKELHKKEKDIFKQLRSCITKAQPVEQRNELVEKRDTILESLILLCTRFCIRYVERNSSLSPDDMFVFFATMGLLDYSRPYVKFWEIMKRVGY
jgi:hypothetical protein